MERRTKRTKPLLRDRKERNEVPKIARNWSDPSKFLKILHTMSEKEKNGINVNGFEDKQKQLIKRQFRQKVRT